MRCICQYEKKVARVKFKVPEYAQLVIKFLNGGGEEGPILNDLGTDL